MAADTTIRVIHSKSRAALDKLIVSSGSPKQMALRLAEYFTALASGHEQGTLEVYVGGTTGVAASATATFASIVADNVVTINGVAFTAKDSGATGNEFNIGASDTTAAAACAAAINASVTAKIAGYVSATSSGAVVTISALRKGVGGNMFTLTKTGNPITVTGSGFLTSGAGENTALVSYSVTP
jgi:hypothetical protein